MIPISCQTDSSFTVNSNEVPQVERDSWLKLTRDAVFSPGGVWIALIIAGGIATGFSRGIRIIRRS